jgi:hypothetical protein
MPLRGDMQASGKRVHLAWQETTRSPEAHGADVFHPTVFLEWV